MLSQHEIMQTIQMIDQQHLDIRTITMGISLLDCADPDPKAACQKIYDKITRRAEHLENTFEALLELGCIPVVNENDSVSSAEIETGRHKVLGDNDTLSAIVAELCRADLLVLLSDIDGLYDADPKTHPEAKLLHQVTELTPEILEMAGGAGSWRGTGGMATKLSAARIAMEAGCDMVITNGSRMEDLYGIAEGKDIGTRFVSVSYTHLTLPTIA